MLPPAPQRLHPGSGGATATLTYLYPPPACRLSSEASALSRRRLLSCGCRRLSLTPMLPAIRIHLLAILLLVLPGSAEASGTHDWCAGGFSRTLILVDAHGRLATRGHSRSHMSLGPPAGSAAAAAATGGVTVVSRRHQMCLSGVPHDKELPVGRPHWRCRDALRA
eukprot:scaffold1290_cov115-Isochrysis_galbana.AAC.2